MYPLAPVKAFIHDRVYEQPHWIGRAERVIDACAHPPREIVRVTDANLCEVVEELNSLWPPKDVPPGVERTYTRPLVFCVQSLEPDDPDITKPVERCGGESSRGAVRALLGAFKPVQAYHVREDDQKTDFVCWPTFDFRTMGGCPHGCHYCGEGRNGKFVTLGVNLEEFMEVAVTREVAAHPFQKCFRMIGAGAEQIAFEPEYGCFELFLKKLASLDRYGYFHAAGENVDWVADVEHKDRLVGVFSVTCDAVARQIEPGAGTAYGRFDAAGRLNAMGVSVRPKFKPIIPIKNWREENARAVEEMFKRCQPESVGLCVIMWMNVDTLLEKIDESLLDPAFLAAARAGADELRDVKTGPYPHAVRKEIYQHFIREIRKYDKKVPVYISTESREMWDELEGELGQKSCGFFCGCGPVALPGRKLALSEDFKYSTYSPTAADPVAAV